MPTSPGTTTVATSLHGKSLISGLRIADELSVVAGNERLLIFPAVKCASYAAKELRYFQTPGGLA